MQSCNASLCFANSARMPGYEEGLADRGSDRSINQQSAFNNRPHTSMGSPLSSGTKLDRYEILSQLGAGGMGEVYLAEDTSMHRRLAPKILPTEVASHHDRRRRFIKEATAAASLNHPSLAHIYRDRRSGRKIFRRTDRTTVSRWARSREHWSTNG